MSFSSEITLWVRLLATGTVLLCAAQTPPLPISLSSPAKAANFTTDVERVLTTNCAGCHGGATHIKEMDLGSVDGVLRGSESGPVVVPGKPDESRLYQMVRDGKMPMGKPRLKNEELALIRSWI